MGLVSRAKDVQPTLGERVRNHKPLFAGVCARSHHTLVRSQHNLAEGLLRPMAPHAPIIQNRLDLRTKTHGLGSLLPATSKNKDQEHNAHKTHGQPPFDRFQTRPGDPRTADHTRCIGHRLPVTTCLSRGDPKNRLRARRCKKSGSFLEYTPTASDCQTDSALRSIRLHANGFLNAEPRTAAARVSYQVTTMLVVFRMLRGPVRTLTVDLRVSYDHPSCLATPGARVTPFTRRSLGSGKP